MAQEIASQMALRNCSKEVRRASIHIHTYVLGRGGGALWEMHLVKHKNITASHKGFPGGSVVKNLPAMQETQV